MKNYSHWNTQESINKSKKMHLGLRSELTTLNFPGFRSTIELPRLFLFKIQFLTVDTTHHVLFYRSSRCMCVLICGSFACISTAFFMTIKTYGHLNSTQNVLQCMNTQNVWGWDGVKLNVFLFCRVVERLCRIRSLDNVNE